MEGKDKKKKDQVFKIDTNGMSFPDVVKKIVKANPDKANKGSKSNKGSK